MTDPLRARCAELEAENERLRTYVDRLTDDDESHVAKNQYMAAQLSALQAKYELLKHNIRANFYPEPVDDWSHGFNAGLAAARALLEPLPSPNRPRQLSSARLTKPTFPR